MNKFLKAFFLSAILLIPIAIFLFLKFFGDNRFDIPVYYQYGVQEVFEDCSSSSTEQFRVDGVLKSDQPGIYFFLSNNKPLTNVANIRQRITEAVGGVSTTIYSADTVWNESDEVKYLDSAQFKTRMRCGFVTDTVNQFVLVDSKKRIRGYYNTEREDIDRLIVELKILLENDRERK